jgi:hypothetical protein
MYLYLTSHLFWRFRKPLVADTFDHKLAPLLLLPWSEIERLRLGGRRPLELVFVDDELLDTLAGVCVFEELLDMEDMFDASSEKTT